MPVGSCRLCRLLVMSWRPRVRTGQTGLKPLTNIHAHVITCPYRFSLGVHRERGVLKQNTQSPPGNCFAFSSLSCRSDFLSLGFVLSLGHCCMVCSRALHFAKQEGSTSGLRGLGQGLFSRVLGDPECPRVASYHDIQGAAR
jgi:hypothetical protein